MISRSMPHRIHIRQNPTEFVRNVDLAFDMTAYIFDKLGMSDKYNGMVERINKALDEIL